MNYSCLEVIKYQVSRGVLEFSGILIIDHMDESHFGAIEFKSKRHNCKMLDYKSANCKLSMSNLDEDNKRSSNLNKFDSTHNAY